MNAPPRGIPLIPADRLQLEGSSAAILPWVFRGNLWAAQSNREDAVNKMIAHGAPAQAVRLVKSPVSAITTTDAGYNSAVTALIESTATVSAFLRMLQDGAFQRVPFRTRCLITTTPGTAVQVGEGAAKPISDVVVTSVVLPVVKALAQSVFTNEVLSDVSARGQQYFHRQLVTALAKAVDTVFCDLLTHTGTPTNATAGPTAANAMADLRVAQLAVNTSGAGKLYWLMGPAVANRASALDAAGIPIFPTLSASGGTLLGAPALVSAGVPANEIYLIDGSGIAANSDTIELRKSSQTSVQMDTAPTGSSATPTATTLVSMFQADSTVLLVEAIFGAITLRDNAVHVTTGVNWGG
jgi:HK97 family phage major capsid protein